MLPRLLGSTDALRIPCRNAAMTITRNSAAQDVALSSSREKPQEASSRQGLRSRVSLSSSFSHSEAGGKDVSRVHGKRRSPPEAASAASKRLQAALPAAKRRSERLKGCVRVEYSKLDRFGTKEPVFQQQVEQEVLEVEDVVENTIQEEEEIVVKQWGQKKRRCTRSGAGEGVAWRKVDVVEVYGVVDVKRWILRRGVVEDGWESQEGNEGGQGSVGRLEAEEEEEGSHSRFRKRQKVDKKSGVCMHPRIQSEDGAIARREGEDRRRTGCTEDGDEESGKGVGVMVVEEFGSENQRCESLELESGKGDVSEGLREGDKNSGAEIGVECGGDVKSDEPVQVYGCREGNAVSGRGQQASKADFYWSCNGEAGARGDQQSGVVDEAVKEDGHMDRETVEVRQATEIVGDQFDRDLDGECHDLAYAKRLGGNAVVEQFSRGVKQEQLHNDCSNGLASQTGDEQVVERCESLEKQETVSRELCGESEFEIQDGAKSGLEIIFYSAPGDEAARTAGVQDQLRPGLGRGNSCLAPLLSEKTDEANFSIPDLDADRGGESSAKGSEADINHHNGGDEGLSVPRERFEVAQDSEGIRRVGLPGEVAGAHLGSSAKCEELTICDVGDADEVNVAHQKDRQIEGVEAEISELQKCLLESFHSFQEPAVSEDSSLPKDSKELMINRSEGYYSENEKTSESPGTKEILVTANVFPGYGVYAQIGSQSGKEDIALHKDMTKGMKASKVDVMEAGGSGASMVMGSGSKLAVEAEGKSMLELQATLERSDHALQVLEKGNCKLANGLEEGWAELGDFAGLKVNQTWNPSELEGSAIGTVAPGDDLGGEEKKVDFSSIGEREGEQAVPDLSSQTTTLIESPTESAVEDQGAEHLQICCSLPRMESLPLAIEMKTCVESDCPSLEDDDQALSMDPYGIVKVYCRRKRGRNVHLFGMEGVDSDRNLPFISPRTRDKVVRPVYEEDVPITNGVGEEKEVSQSVIANQPGVGFQFSNRSQTVAQGDQPCGADGREDQVIFPSDKDGQYQAVLREPDDSSIVTGSGSINSESSPVGYPGLGTDTILHSSPGTLNRILETSPHPNELKIDANLPVLVSVGSSVERLEQGIVVGGQIKGLEESCSIRGMVVECGRTTTIESASGTQGIQKNPFSLCGHLAAVRDCPSISNGQAFVDVTCDTRTNDYCLHGRGTPFFAAGTMGDTSGNGVQNIDFLESARFTTVSYVDTSKHPDIDLSAPFCNGKGVREICIDLSGAAVSLSDEQAKIAIQQSQPEAHEGGSWHSISEQNNGACLNLVEDFLILDELSVKAGSSKESKMPQLIEQKPEVESQVGVQNVSVMRGSHGDTSKGNLPSVEHNLKSASDRTGDQNDHHDMDEDGNSVSQKSSDVDPSAPARSQSTFLMGLKCGLCGGSSDGCPPKEMLAGNGEFLRGKSLLDYGEGFDEGRGWLGQLIGPLTCRIGVKGVWVHRQCAIWSPEVYFSGVGRLKNVRAALRRGRYLRCTSCSLPGATIGCCMERCPRTFHLPCARLEGCVFDHGEYLMTCIDHMYLLHPGRQRKSGGMDDISGIVGFENVMDFNVGGFSKMVRERRIAAAAARLKDLEAEEKWVQASAEDDEFSRRERKRLQRDLARIVPLQLGGQLEHGDGGSVLEGWESVAGLQDVIQALKEVVTIPLIYPDLYARLGISAPRGVLLHGHPGTGKTHVVRAMVGACARGSQKVAYFARKGADCLGKYVGDSERQLRLLFRIAEECQPSIIFFDEIDGLAPSRTGQNDQTHSSVVSTLLALMDGLNPRGSVVVIGATNRADALDPALRRPGRFDREIFFPLPSMNDRKLILALHTRKWVPTPSGKLLSAVARVTSGFAGADLQALCVEAAMTALRRSCPLSEFIELASKGQGLSHLPTLPSMRIRASDWASALRNVSPPCSKRVMLTASGATRAAALPKHMMYLLLPSVLEVLLTLHLDSRVLLPLPLQKAMILVKKAVSTAAGYDLNGQSFPPNWPVFLQEWPFESVVAKDVDEALIKVGILSSADGLQFSDSACFSGSDCDSSDTDVDNCVSSAKDQDALPSSKSGLDVNSGSMDSSSLASSHRSSLQGRMNVMITGPRNGGQSLVAAALLHGFESFARIWTLSLPTMLQEGNGTMDAGLVYILGEAKRSAPSIVFLPNFESWALESVPSASQEHLEIPSLVCEENQSPISRKTLQPGSVGRSTFAASGYWNLLLQLLNSTCPSAPILLLATSEICVSEHPSSVAQFFSICDGNPSTQMVPSVVVQVPCENRIVDAIFDSASGGIATSLAVDFLRRAHHLAVRPNKVDQFFSLDKSGIASGQVTSDEVAAGSTLHSVTKESVLQEDQVKAAVEHNSLLIRTGSGDDNLVDSMCSFKPGSGKPLLEGKEFIVRGQGFVDKAQHSNLDKQACDVLPPEQRDLMLAIGYCCFQLLQHPQFSDLRRATAKLKLGPQVNILDSSGLNTFKLNEYCRQFSQQQRHAGSSDGSGHEKPTEIWVRGIVAVGLLGCRGLYSTGTEVACEVRKVIELLFKRISESVQNGAKRWDYFDLTAQAAELEDLLGTWLYEVHRLERCAGVSVLKKRQLAELENSMKVPSSAKENDCRNVCDGQVAEDCTKSMVNYSNGDCGCELGESETRRVSDEQYGDAGFALHGASESQSTALNGEESNSFQEGLVPTPTLLHHPDRSERGQLNGCARAEVVEKNSASFRFTKACMHKLKVVVKSLLVDTWKEHGSTTSAELVDDLITGCAASAITACRGHLKALKRQFSLSQNGTRLACESDVCWRLSNCLCRTSQNEAGVVKQKMDTWPKSPLEEGTGGTGPSLSKDDHGLGIQSALESCLAPSMMAHNTGEGAHVSSLRTDTLQRGHRVMCLCPVVTALTNLKPKVGLQMAWKKTAPS